MTLPENNPPHAPTRPTAWSWERHRPAQAGVGALVAMVLLGLLFGKWKAHTRDQAEQTRDRIGDASETPERPREPDQARDRLARQQSYATKLASLARLIQQGTSNPDLLTTLRPEPAQEDVRGFEWYYLRALARGRSFSSLPGHAPEEAWAVAFSPDGRRLASAGDDHCARLWDLADGREIGVFPGHGALASCLAYSPDGRRLATGSYDCKVRVWDITNPDLPLTCTRHTHHVRCVAFSPDGRTLASGGRDNTVRLWDVASGRHRAVLPGHNDHVWAVAFTPDGRLLVSADSGGMIFLWDPVRQTSESIFVGVGLERLALAPNGQTLAVGTRDGCVQIWQLGRITAEIIRRGHDGRRIRSLAFTPDGRTLASAGEDKAITLWQVATGDPLLTLPDQPHFVNSLAFSPDGQTLAAALHDGTLRLWHAPRGD